MPGSLATFGWPLLVSYLAGIATSRLDEFIEDAEELIKRMGALSEQVTALVRPAYEASERLYEAKIMEARSLRELTTGVSIQSAIAAEIDNAFLSCSLVTNELRQGWVSELDEALAHYQAGIGRLNQAEAIAPELSSKYIEAAVEMERFMAQASSLQDGPHAPEPSGNEDDHDNTTSEATPTELPCSIVGSIGHVGDLDYFSFQAEAGGTCVIEAVGGDTDEFRATIYDARGRQFGSSYYGQLTHTAAVAEALYVMVQNNRGRTGSYTLSIKVPSDDHGNSILKATPVEVPSATEGVIKYLEDLDYFSFQGQAGTTYLVETAQGTTEGFTVAVQRSGGPQPAPY